MQHSTCQGPCTLRCPCKCRAWGPVKETLTEELLEEGFVREIISKVQTMRKENGFEVTDHIKVSLSGNDKLQALVQKNESYLKEITLVDEVAYGTTDGTAKEWNINGENVTIAVK